MNLNLHGYKYNIGDVAWVLDGSFNPRRGICVNVVGDNYHVLMDDNGSTEIYTHPDLFPLQSYAEIKRQLLITPTPTITPSSTPAITRTPRPSPTPSPTPSPSFVNKQNLLSTGTATWTSTDGTVSILSSDKIKLTSNIPSDNTVYLLSPEENLLSNVGVAFTTTATVQTHSDYMLSFDLEQGSCRFISVKVTRNNGTDTLFARKYMDSTRVSLVLNSYDSTSMTITIQLYDDSNFNKKARHGRYYVVNRMKMLYIKANNIPAQPTPTPTTNAIAYADAIAAKNPTHYWSLDTDTSATIGTNALTLGTATSLVSDSHGHTLLTTTGTAGDTFGATLATPVNLSTNYSLEAWINVSDLSNYANIFGTTDAVGTGFILNGDGTLSLYGNNDYFEINFGFQLNTDYHVVLTVDSSGNIIMYVNGAEFAYGDSNSSSNVSVDTYEFAHIGSDPADETLIGKIGNPAIYDHVLTPAQVLENYNSGTNGYRYTPTTVVAPSAPVFLPYTLSRLNSDGSIDTGFADIKPNNSVQVLKKFNTKIAIGGDFTAFNPTLTTHVFSLNSDGTLNTTKFILPSDITENTPAVVCQALDGKVYAAGTTSHKLFRYNSDGTLDSSYTFQLNGDINTIAVHPTTGKIYIGGNFTTANNYSATSFARLNSDGTIDNIYSMNTGNFQQVTGIKITNDGKIYVYGNNLANLGANTVTNNLARLNSDGTFDSTFAGISGLNGNNIDVFEQISDGKIYIGGLNKALYRLNSDGTVDGTFTQLSYIQNQALKEYASKIYFSWQTSNASSTTYGISRMNSDGTLDNTYTSITTNDIVMSMEVSSDNKLYISGAFDAVNGTTYNKVARINSDGTLDTTFTNVKVATGIVQTGPNIQKISTGELLLSGEFGSVGGNVYNKLAMLNSDGSVDTTFTGVSITGGVSDIMVSGDSKLYYSGSFNTAATTNAPNHNRLIGRLNSDGTFDNGFTYAYGVNPTNSAVVYQLLQTSDGKLYVKLGNSSSNTIIMRQNSDGTDDIGYTSPTFNGTIYSMYQTSDGKIYVGGAFTTVNGLTYVRLCRLNSDGSLDTTFVDVGIPAGGAAFGGRSGVNAIIQATDGKIYVGGGFPSMGASTSPYLGRLNSDGTVDSTFGVSIANAVSALKFIGGKLYIVNLNKLNRLNLDYTLDNSFEYTSHNGINGLYEHIDGKIYVACGYVAPV